MLKIKKIRYAIRCLYKKFDRFHDSCPSCSSTNYKIIRSKEFIKFPTSLRHCDECLLLYRHPTTLENESKKFYEKEYSQKGLTTDLPNLDELKNLMATNFKNSEKDFSFFFPFFYEISKKLGRKIKILDYGSNWGYLIYQLKSLDFVDIAMGYEYSKVMRSYGERYLKVKYINEDEFNNQFDVIFSSHTIEHMFNPSIFKSHIEKLTRDGYCIITCPNGSLNALFENPTSWRSLWGEVHPNFISDEYLINQFYDYEGGVFSLPKYDIDISFYLKNLTLPPCSFLPKEGSLLAIFKKI